MRAWMKWTIVGAVWGIVSLIGYFIISISSMAHAPVPALSVFKIIIMVPSLITRYLGIDPITSWFLPIFIGGLLIGGIAFLVDKWR